MIKVYFYVTILCVFFVSHFVYAECTQDEIFILIDANYKKPEIETICSDQSKCAKASVLKMINAGYTKTEIQEKCHSNPRNKSKLKNKNIYVVKKGDTLSKIAKKQLGEINLWIELYRANKHIIKDADRINIGQKLIIPVISKQSIKRKKRNDVIKLVTGNKYAPFSDEKLPRGGMITEIVNEVFKGMGKETSIDFWSWKYGYDATLAGEFVATFPYLKNEERTKLFYYSKPLYDIMILPFVKKNSSIKYNKLDDLKGLSVCRPEGYYIHDIQPLIDKDAIDLKRPEDLDDCFKMLVNGTVDVVPANEFSAKSEIHKLKLDDKIKALETPVSVDTLHIIFPKKRPGARMLQYKFDQQVIKLEESGRLEKIKTNHLDHFWKTFQ